MALGMIGRKVGMTRLYDGRGRVRAVTVIEVEPNPVTQIRTTERDGYEAVQIGARGDRKRTNRPQRGHLRRAEVEAPLTVLQEFRVDDAGEYKLGQEFTVEQFEPGQYVDVTGVSRGRGFAGGVRRWGFAGGPKTHGQSDRHRAPGSIGAGTTPGRVWKGQKMAGHMGARNKTVLNLLVVLTDPARRLIFVEGSVPGPRLSMVTVRPGRKPVLADYQPPEPFAPPEVETPPAPPATEPESAEDEYAAGAVATESSTEDAEATVDEAMSSDAEDAEAGAAGTADDGAVSSDDGDTDDSAASTEDAEPAANDESDTPDAADQAEKAE